MANEKPFSQCSKSKATFINPLANQKIQRTCLYDPLNRPMIWEPTESLLKTVREKIQPNFQAGSNKNEILFTQIGFRFWGNVVLKISIEKMKNRENEYDDVRRAEEYEDVNG